MNVDLKAFDKLSYGLYLISSKGEAGPAGCVVNTLTQATVEPVRATVTVHKENATARAMLESRVFAAVALSQAASMQLIGAFGFHSSRDFDKFGPYQTRRDCNGVLYVCEQVVARMSFRVMETMDAGTHLVFLGEAQEAEVLEDVLPMTYLYYHKIKRGLTPPKASSYRPKTVSGYRCGVCGYILEADEVPDGFVCPICGRGKEVMEKIGG